MKKIMAAALCALLCLTAFTGCSATELGYLDMCRDMMDTMQACRATGQVQADLDFDGLKDFLSAISEEVGGGSAPEDMEGLSGKHSVLLDYTMQMNLGQMEYSMDIDLSYRGKKYEMGELYVGMRTGMSVSSETLMGVYRLARDLADGMEGSYFFSSEFERALAQELGSRQIILYSMEDMGLTAADIDEMMPTGGFGSVYDAAFRFYEDLLAGFDTGETLVTKISGGYRIEADGKAVGRLLASLLDFFAEHPEQLLDAAETYMTEVAGQTGGAETEEEMRALFATWKAQAGDVAEALHELSGMWKETMRQGAVQTVLDSFRYRASVTGGSGRFTSEGGYDITYRGAKVLRIASKTTCVKNAAAISFPKTGMTLEEAGAKLEGLTERFNPAAGAALTWGFESTATQAMLEVRRQERTPFGLGGGASLEELAVRNGRAYVPLRAICDALGESVTWNKAERKAYITKDGNTVAMDGILEGGKTFVGVREFEKLGYTVTYRSVDGLKEAVIMK